MATSGSIDFNLTAIQLIEEAFKLIGVKAQEQPLQAAEAQDGFVALNLMVKNWQAQGLHLWTKTEAIFFIQPGRTDYFLGPTGQEATNFDDFVNTTLTVAAAATATTITVESTAGMTSLDRIGIELDDETRQWTTIVSVDNPTDLTITDGLTDSAAINNTVFVYTNQLERPIRILGVRRGNTDSDTEIEVRPYDSRYEYFTQPTKTSPGTIVNYYYTPELGNGRIYVWQTGETVRDFIRFTYERSIEDFDINSNDPDFPIEWSEALKYQLAVKIGIQYGITSQRLGAIKAIADELLDLVLGFDVDNLFVSVQPEMN